MQAIQQHAQQLMAVLLLKPLQPFNAAVKARARARPRTNARGRARARARASAKARARATAGIKPGCSLVRKYTIQS